MTKIEDRLDAEYAAAWRPEAGETLVGKVVDISRLVSTYDGVTPYPCVTVQPPAGDPLAFHAFHDIAKRELSRVRPKVGDTIGIKYAGMKETGSGRKAHLYRIASENESAFSWDEFGDGVGDDAEPANPAESDDLPF